MAGGFGILIPQLLGIDLAFFVQDQALELFNC
jgi:hypothetical protein